jgi:tetratricopeptide (TPR) repeat protein
MSSNAKRWLVWTLGALGLVCAAGWSGCVGRDTHKANKARKIADPSGYFMVGLKELNAGPQQFLNRKVCFKAYFAGKTSFYMPFRTPFTPGEYVNFTVWPAGAKLWLPAEMDESLPYLYVPRETGGIIEKDPERPLDRLDHFKRFQPIMVYGTVASDHNRAAWIVADTFRPADGGSYTAEAIHRLKLATTRYEQKQYDLAAKDFDASLKLGIPQEVEGSVRRSLGLSRLGMEDYAGAAEALSRAEREGCGDAEALVGLAEAQLELGRYGEAEKAARGALVKDPTSVLGRAHLAVALGGQGQTAAGLAECADGLKLAPGDADVLRAQGVVLGLAGKEQLDAAIEVYKQAVLARATDVRIQRELGQLYLRKGDFTKAKESFENVVNLSKGNTRAYCRGCCLLGEAFEGLAKPEDAANQYLLAQKRDENYMPAYLSLGSLFAKGGREKEAVEQYMVVAQRLDPKGEQGFQAWRRAAELYRTKPENMAKAAECYEQAARVKPKDCANWLDLASARWEQPKPDRKAVEAALRRAAEADPKAHAPRFRLGVLLNEMGDVPGSVAQFEAAKQRSPKDVPTLLRLGQSYRRLCRDDDALKEFEAAAALAPTNLDVKNSLAYALADAGRLDGLMHAEKLASETVAAKPGEAAYLDTLGWVQVKLNKTKEAIATLEKAGNASSDADVMYHLARAYANDRQYDKAIEKLTAAEVKLRQGRLGCPSCKRLQESVLKLLAQSKEDKARATPKAPEPKKAPTPAPVKK